MAWTEAKRAIALDPNLSCSQAARKLHVSRAAVAGLRWRVKNPPETHVRKPRQPARYVWQIAIRVDLDTLAEIDEYVKLSKAPGRSAALRDLVEWGLEAAKELK